MLWNCSFPEATTRSFTESGPTAWHQVLKLWIIASTGLLTAIWTLTFYLDSSFDLGFGMHRLL
jgi:hypothetical protein